MRKNWTAYSNPSHSTVGERHDCAVRALAIALGAEYDNARALYAAYGRKPRQGTPSSVTAALMQWVGATTVDHWNPRSLLNLTLAQFIQAHPTGCYWLARRGHAFALLDGVVHDWRHGTGARSRIVQAYRMP